MKITEHFDSKEFDQPAGHGMIGRAYPPAWCTDVTRLPALCAALEVLRSHFGKPVAILSGYRSPEYNDALYAARGEPATKSQHSQGRAADITIAGVTPDRVHAACLELYTQGKLKIGGLGKYPSFTHVDVRVGWDHLARWEQHGG